MNAVIAAIFVSHDRAVQVHTQFVRAGFPSERVRLTSLIEVTGAPAGRGESAMV